MREPHGALAAPARNALLQHALDEQRHPKQRIDELAEFGRDLFAAPLTVVYDLETDTHEVTWVYRERFTVQFPGVGMDRFTAVILCSFREGE